MTQSVPPVAQTAKVPGLPQTEDYARAILSARPDGNLSDLDEGVLHRPIDGAKVMRSQLFRLAELAENPRTTIQLRRSRASLILRLRATSRA
jgi:Domain of unknown function (DUF5753)